ncbi:terminase large subunit [Shewanella sp. phage 1/41]|uniref:terminase large subunit n=1 Tax=Shewanella sp. phage 1/41 TaxID=1458861 RepID=UPI0004F7D4AA|nr:terminase large subunit [Shewanella sp. phage 1/41]AHK11656.1 terminase large subunit [Shewanella sp. phage 1/41]
MSKRLDFRPQKVFAPAYNLNTKVIMAERSFFSSMYDYFVDFGGRGGGKTKDKIKAVVLESTIRRVRVLVTREFQESISESVKAEIETCIDELDLGHFFRITEDKIVALNGSKFVFKGLKKNINNIKSIANVDIVLVEEAENVSENSWDKLLPSIRPVSGRAIVIVIFNPASELDATWQTWIVNTPLRTLLTECNYPDNKYFPAFLEAQRLHDERVLPPKRYKNKWLGIPAGSEGDIIIDQDWLKAARFASRHADWEIVGPKVVAYDPAGQGKDSHAVAYSNGNCVTEIDEWPLSPDLRVATNRALSMARKHEADEFTYDECGGFGDGVSVFAKDNVEGISTDEDGVNFEEFDINVTPFNAGDSIEKPEDWDESKKIKGTEKTPYEIYCNQKAHAHGVVAQQLYNTYRFIELGERGIDFNEMLSLDIEDDAMWKKIMREMSTALWVKSESNSKKKVESKENMKNRTGQESPNINDAIIMLRAPRAQESLNFMDVDWS